MVEYSKEVEKLAETLKNSGLVASMKDALERAQSMIGKKEAKEPDEPFEKPTDTTQTTLSDMGSIKKEGVQQLPEEELKKEEVFANKQEENKEKANEKKVDYSEEKKVDLSKIFNSNK